MSELTSLRNIGKELDKKLKSINITTVDERKAVYFAGKKYDRLNYALLKEEYK